MNDPARPHRGTIFLEDTVLLAVHRWPEDQFVLRLQAPRCAAAATAGSFVHLQCDEAIPMRRPLSILRADPEDGWIEVLFKVVGGGLEALARRRPGDVLSSLGPIGRGFRPRRQYPRTLLIGGGVGIPPMIFLAETLMREPSVWEPLVLMGSEIPFPFECSSSAFDVAGVGPATDRAMSLLETWNVPSRLASLADIPATYRGYVTALAAEHLAALSPGQLAATEVFACGPTPMLAAAAKLAADFRLPCQVSLEEYMACAVGGCAGCTVLVHGERGAEMKRVCVDGPVFDAAQVFPGSGRGDSPAAEDPAPRGAVSRARAR